MPASVSSSAGHGPFIRSGFVWDAADAFLFDIDGTLLNSHDSVHSTAFQHAIREVLGIEATIDGVPVHGNTDIGIVRAVLKREGLEDDVVNAHLPQIVEQMCVEVMRNSDQLQPEICPSIPDLIARLESRGKLLGAASGNLEPIGWLKLKKAKLRSRFLLGSFAWPRESRTEILAHGVELVRQRRGPGAAVCVVGDTPSDIAAARAVGATVIALSTGVYPFSQLAAGAPDACLASAADLLSLT
jgi:phosphoglycolate phosphatase